MPSVGTSRIRPPLGQGPLRGALGPCGRSSACAQSCTQWQAGSPSRPPQQAAQCGQPEVRVRRPVTGPGLVWSGLVWSGRGGPARPCQAASPVVGQVHSLARRPATAAGPPSATTTRSEATQANGGVLHRAGGAVLLLLADSESQCASCAHSSREWQVGRCHGRVECIRVTSGGCGTRARRVAHSSSIHTALAGVPMNDPS